MPKKITIDGRSAWQALAYAYEVCPAGDDSKLSQVVLIDRRVVCSDGKRWHVGYLPEEAALTAPLVIARESIRELLRRIEFCDELARSHGGAFFLHMNGVEVELQYGDESMRQRLQSVNVGHVPSTWKPPVEDNAPAVAAAAVESGHMIDAAKWWRSWEKDHGTVQAFGHGPDKPVRFDVRHRGELVGQSYVLASSAYAAQLPPDEPLFEKLDDGTPAGQSILDLRTDLPPPKRSEGKARKAAAAVVEKKPKRSQWPPKVEEVAPKKGGPKKVRKKK
jgi:hypothetical protein